jgi:S1-C subfamily serine protease
MVNDLVAGANAPIPGDVIGIRVRSNNANSVEFAVAVLPIGGADHPWLPLQEAPPPYAEGGPSGIDFTLKLSRLGDAVQTVALVLYTSTANATLMSLRDVSVEIGDHNVKLSHSELSVPSIVFAELYRRNGQWKIRAKRDGVFDGIEELGRRLGVAVTDRRREEQSRRSPEAEDRPSRTSRSGTPNWTGSGSLIADRYLVTNAHVVKDANEVFVSGFTGRVRSEPVIVDETNDLALVRLSDSVGSSGIVFRDSGVHLGEAAYAIGYPLSGLLGRGPQFTSGSVSNLLGPGDDARLMQITCPIQPGSSGGPVFDDSGYLIAVVAATLQNAQNVNFAIRSALVLPLLDAANIDFQRKDKGQQAQISDIVRTNSPFVWRVECFA